MALPFGTRTTGPITLRSPSIKLRIPPAPVICFFGSFLAELAQGQQPSVAIRFAQATRASLHKQAHPRHTPTDQEWKNSLLNTPKPTPILIDTDPGIDDAMAILMAFAEPKVEVVGLTAVFGNVDVDKATRNAAPSALAGKSLLPEALPSRARKHRSLTAHSFTVTVALVTPSYRFMVSRRPRKMRLI